MWSTILGAIIILVSAVFVWRFVTRVWAYESEEPARPDDATVPARIKPRPHLNAGAVALEEPDDDEQ